jgi:hypothetical protein
MRVQKTDRARAELKPGVRTLGQRERTAVASRRQLDKISDFRGLFAGDGEDHTTVLRTAAEPTRPARNRGFASRCPAGRGICPASVNTSPAPRPQANRASTDQFEGKRSLFFHPHVLVRHVNACLRAAVQIHLSDRESAVIAGMIGAAFQIGVGAMVSELDRRTRRQNLLFDR